jgi:hypothetical protein
MKLQPFTLRSFVMNEYGLTEKQLFHEVNVDRRDTIINHVFEKYGTFRLYPDGLVNLNDPKDKFDNYTSFNHLTDFQGLAFDITYTKKKSKKIFDRYKRKQHLTKKKRLYEAKYKAINDLTKKEYTMKWEPNNKGTKNKLEKLKKLKKQEQDKDFER